MSLPLKHIETEWRIYHVSIIYINIASNNGLSPARQQAIIGTNAGLFSVRSMRRNLSEYAGIEKHYHSTVTSAKLWAFCLINDKFHMCRTLLLIKPHIYISICIFLPILMSTIFFTISDKLQNSSCGQMLILTNFLIYFFSSQFNSNRKVCFSVIPSAAMILIYIFAHATASQLSCQVQHFVVISSFIFG